MSYCKRICLAVLVLLCLEISVNAGTATAQTGISVAVQPLFLINNAGKIDVELQPAGSKFGYIFTAEVYGGRIKDGDIFRRFEDENWDKVSGAGIGVSQKYRFRDKGSSPYVAYGLTYRYQEIPVETEGFYTYQENGLTYYGYGPGEKNLVISSGLVSAVLGYQKTAGDFLIDFYFGGGYKAQLKNTDFDGLRRFNRYQYSYAYKGAVVLIGVKVGFRFR